MLAQHTPAPLKDIERSVFLDEMYRKWFLEVGRWSAHLPDSVILDTIDNDKNLMLYAVNFGGVPMYSHAGCKSFFANIKPHNKKRKAWKPFSKPQR